MSGFPKKVEYPFKAASASLYCFTVFGDFMSFMQHMLVESKASGE